MSDQRYEPLPGFDQLPAWLWRRTGTRARLAIGGAVLLAIVMAVVLIPAARQAQRDRAAAESAERAERHAQGIRALQAEQRPRYGRSDSVAASRRGRAVVLRGTRGARSSPTPADAGSRPDPARELRAVPGHRRQPRPRTTYAPPRLLRLPGDHVRDRAHRRNAAGVLGHPYRAAVDFETGRFAFCKVAGRPDPIPDPKVVTPRACSS